MLSQKAEYLSQSRIKEKASQDKEFKEELEKTEKRVISEFLKVKVNAIMAMSGFYEENKESNKTRH